MNLPSLPSQWSTNIERALVENQGPTEQFLLGVSGEKAQIVTVEIVSTGDGEAEHEK